jgi:hypothetical protein
LPIETWSEDAVGGGSESEAREDSDSSGARLSGERARG